MTKKSLVVLAALLCLALLPMAARAEDPIVLHINEGSIVISSDTYSVGGVWPVPYTPGTEFVIGGETKEHTIIVSDRVTANIMLYWVKIDLSGKDMCAFNIGNGATVNLTLPRGPENEIKSGGANAGIHVPEGATLNIIGEGSLEVHGGTGGGAGIGGSFGEGAGKITIGKGIDLDPVVEAYGGGGGAGIGGGANGGGGQIIINGHWIEARGGNSGGAGIGCGAGGSGGTITLNMGILNTYCGGEDGAAIDGERIIINGGAVAVNYRGRGSASKIGINGKEVIFTGGSLEAHGTDRAFADGVDFTPPLACLYWIENESFGEDWKSFPEAGTTFPAIGDKKYVGIVGRPSQPQNVVAVPGYEKATVTFAPPARDGDNKILHYTVYIYSTDDPDVPADGIKLEGEEGATAIVVTGLKNGFKYTFKVAANARLAGIVSPLSEPSNIVTPGDPSEENSGSGGCNAGAGGLILLALFFMFVHKQKRTKALSL